MTTVVKSKGPQLKSLKAMDFGRLVLVAGLLGPWAIQGNNETTAQTSGTDRATCLDSDADICLRTCCAKGQHAINRKCTNSSTEWKPPFLNQSALEHLDIVGGPISPCGFGQKQITLSQYIDPFTNYILRPSGELDVQTPGKNYTFGHQYCFYNVEQNSKVFESVRGCAPIDVPQVPGLATIDNVQAVSVRKCCDLDEVLDVVDEGQRFVCVNDTKVWQPQVIHGYPTELIQLPPEKANISAEGRFECPKDTVPQYLTSAIPENVNFLESNSQLRLASYNLSIDPGMFCLDSLRSTSSSPQPISLACYGKAEEHTKEQFEELCPEGLCVRKCCAPHFHLLNNNCVPTTLRWRPTFYDGEDVFEEEVAHNIIHGKANCDNGDRFIFSQRLSRKDTPFLQRNGEIHITKLNLTFEAHQCCLDYETFFNETLRTYDTSEIAVCCYPRDQEATIRDQINSALLTLSAICLFVMLAIYMMVPRLRNIHGKCLMSHAAALFIAFFLTVYNQLVGVRLGSSCDLLGFLLYYSFIAALFWLNVMSFDIWWTFAHLRTQPPSERSLRNRFIRHSVYAWGVPLVMTLLVVFFNYAPYSLIPEDAILRPGIGERKCFFPDPATELYYFYVPIFIVTGVNIVFFLATAWTLYKAEKSSRILNRKRTARDRLKVYVNLFIIMEVSWIAECLSTQIGPVRLWYFTDIINASQGTLIFLLFIVRSSTRQAIKERFVELSKHGFNASNRKVHPAGRTTGEQNAGSSGTKTTSTSTSNRKSSEGDGIPMARVDGEQTAATDGGAGPSTDGQPTDDAAAPDASPAPRDSPC